MFAAELYWVAFNRTPGIGASKMRALLATFGSAAKAWHASPLQLAKVPGLDQRALQSLLQLRSTLDLDQLQAQITQHRVKVLTWESPNYPARLLEVPDSPPVLYVRGELLPADDWAVAIVGTRTPTAYGKAVVSELAQTLAHAGVTVVSGLARGIDTLAHSACLNAGGRSLAVLGSGLDQIYPPENRLLADNMLNSGALLSDYAVGTRPDSKNFPARNRIISGLTLATVIVEAGESSGALITARYAAEQGRDVLAVPGSIYSRQSIGTNRLIRDGAKPVLSANDILEELNLRLVVEHSVARQELPANREETAVLQHLTQEPLHIDEISLLASLPIEQVSSTLAMLELKGRVRQVGGMQFVKIRELSPSYRVE